MPSFDELKNKAEELVSEHADTIDTAIDKAAELADKATDGKYADKIDGAADALKSAADKVDGKP